MDKLKNIEFIKDFSKITVSSACREENVKKSNLYKMTTTPEKIQRIRENIEKRIKALYDKDNSTL